MQADYTFLNDKNRSELKSWLIDALHRRTSLPSVSPDEFPYLGILRVESRLDKLTRRDLIDTCQELVESFVRDPDADEDYARSLLGLATKLQVPVLAPSLARMAEQSETFRKVPLPIQRLVLTTLVELRTEPPPFWRSILAQNEDAFAAVAFSGLFSCNPELAMTVLPRLPERQPVVAAASSRMRRWVETLESTDRSRMEAKLRDALPQCKKLVRQMFEAWVPARSSQKVSSKIADYLSSRGDKLPPVPLATSARLLSTVPSREAA